MAAPKTGQSGSSLPAIITLTTLFLIAAVAAVVFYLKAEGLNSQAQTTSNQMKATRTSESEMKKSFDEIVRMATGQAPAEGPADVSLTAVKDKFQTVMADLASQVEAFKGASAETEGMLSVVERMRDTTIAAKAAEGISQQRVAELSAENETLRKASMEKEVQYAEVVQRSTADATSTQSNFGSLQTQMDQNTKDMVAMVEAKLAASEEAAKSLQTQLEQTKGQLAIASEKLNIAQSQLSAIVPAPDTEVAAFRPDGQIISMDNTAGLVYINLGTADKVYRGLTFSVYDKGIPIPSDGKGKAEIVVLEPKERMSIARIAVSNPRKPVLVDDTIANLVWDSSKSWVFVVVGEFDVDGNGTPDSDGPEKVRALISKWGGTVAADIGPSTDFVVLGKEPKVPAKPGGEEVLTNPALMQRYESALAVQQAYQGIMSHARSLSLPVFNLERLKYMTGYEAMSPKGSALTGSAAQ